jgi:hypothetical protein
VWNANRKYKGSYLGTEIDEIWWKRYKQDKMFARGSGQFWFDDKGMYFHRYLTKEPIHIPFAWMRAFKIGHWHSGRWAMHIPILKIIWHRENHNLSSGFAISKNHEDVISLIRILQEKSSAVFEG